ALTGSMDYTARLWEVATGQPIGPPLRHGNWVLAVAFSPDGQTIVTGGGGQAARLWRIATGRPRGKLLPHLRDFTRLLSPRGNQAFSSTPASLRESQRLPSGIVSALAFSPDGQI